MRGNRTLARLSGTPRLRVALAMMIGLVSGLEGCGGGSGTTGPSATTPAISTTVVGQGNFQLLSVPGAVELGFPYDAIGAEFTVSGAGRLEATVDWTFSTNAVAIAIFRGSCSRSAFYAQSCTEAATQDPTFNKPIHLSLANASAGTYTLVIVNLGVADESGNFRITLTR